jgi:steroid delta-isomerase-like uncharacterized protein
MANAATLQQQMFDAVQGRDFGKLRDLYHPDYSYESSDGDKGGIDAGVGVAEMYTAAFPDLTFEVRHQYSAGENGPAVIELTAKGTHTGPLGELPATGKTVEVLVCNIVESKDGQIIREREYYDALSMMRQLGVAE